MNVKTKKIRYLDSKIFESYKEEIIRDNHFQRILCDYISSMTNVFAVSEYQRLYSGDRILLLPLCRNVCFFKKILFRFGFFICPYVKQKIIPLFLRLVFRNE